VTGKALALKIVRVISDEDNFLQQNLLARFVALLP
jgi:hypothetical protein